MIPNGAFSVTELQVLLDFVGEAATRLRKRLDLIYGQQKDDDERKFSGLHETVSLARPAEAASWGERPLVKSRPAAPAQAAAKTAAQANPRRANRARGRRGLIMGV